MATGTPATEIHYPSGDGQPMAETTVHVRAIVLLHQALEDFFHGREDVFIASDIFWYWEKGNVAARLSPDVMVVTGVVAKDARERRSFFTWREGGAVPAVVFEMASEGTWEDDVGDKLHKYEALGVREYFLFDPLEEFLNPGLLGYRLSGKNYVRLDSPDDVLASELGFELRAEETMIRLSDARTGRLILTRAEAIEHGRVRYDAERIKAAAAQAQAAAAQAQAAAAQAQAAAAQAQARTEKVRADALQAELDRLRRQLGTGDPEARS